MPDSAWWDKVREDRDRPREPGYWQNETSGVLREPIRKYLAREPLTPEEIGCLRAYFRQWIDSPVWDKNPHADGSARTQLQTLRTDAANIRTRRDIDQWLNEALTAGIDPL